ncbi:MAG: hypothetical protein ACJAYU_002917 [Bradymonadia bacterium]|jgi:hypothetical protein
MDAISVAQTVTHYTLHFLAPGLLAWLFFRDQWKRAWLIMLATMLVDLDHLFAYPEVFSADRCGIGFHPLHSYWAIGAYAISLALPALRILATGLLFHMLIDLQDCWWMTLTP